MASEQRDAERAVDDYQEAIRLGTPGAPSEVVWASNGLAVARAVEQLGDARTAARDALSRSYDIRLWMGVLLALKTCAFHLLDTDPEGAATVMGYSSPRATLVTPTSIEIRERTVAAVADMPKGQEWMANGAQMDRHQIVAYAFSRLAD